MLTRSTAEQVEAALRVANPDLADQFVVEFNATISRREFAEYLYDGWQGYGSWRAIDADGEKEYLHYAERAFDFLGGRAFTKRTGDERLGVALVD